MSSSNKGGVSFPFWNGKGESVSEEQRQQQQQQQTHEMDAENGLRLMKEELDNIPDNMKPSFLYAQHAAPDLVCDKHLSRFLYAEGCNAKVSETLWQDPSLRSLACFSNQFQKYQLAAKRVVSYWEQRKKVFGEEYVLPLTLFGAMKNHVQSLYDGYLTLLPQKDNFGRAIIFSNPTILFSLNFRIRFVYGGISFMLQWGMM